MLHLILAGLIAVQVAPVGRPRDKSCFEPCSITVTVKVKEASDNNSVIIEVNSDNYYHRSDLDYTNGGPKTLRITYPNAPAGEYTVTVELKKHDGRDWIAGRDSRRLSILSIGGQE